MENLCSRRLLQRSLVPEEAAAFQETGSPTAREPRPTPGHLPPPWATLPGRTRCLFTGTAHLGAAAHTHLGQPRDQTPLAVIRGCLGTQRRWSHTHRTSNRAQHTAHTIPSAQNARKCKVIHSSRKQSRGCWGQRWRGPQGAPENWSDRNICDLDLAMVSLERCDQPVDFPAELKQALQSHPQKEDVPQLPGCSELQTPSLARLCHPRGRDMECAACCRLFQAFTSAESHD